MDEKIISEEEMSEVVKYTQEHFTSNMKIAFVIMAAASFIFGYKVGDSHGVKTMAKSLTQINKY